MPKQNLRPHFDAPSQSEFIPRLWKSRAPREFASPIHFIEDNYVRVLGEIPTRAFIKKHDLGLYNAYSKWIERHPNDDILPKKTTWDEKLGVKFDLNAKNFDELSKKISASLSREERHNFQTAMSKRRIRALKRNQ